MGGRFRLIAIVGVTLLSLPLAVLPAAAPRLNVSLFTYRGTSDGVAALRFDTFAGILRDKLFQLAEEVADRAENATYLQGLSLIGPLPDRLASAAMVDDWWREQESLLILQGILTPEQSFVRSRIYIGDLRGDLNHSSLVLDLAISAEEFGNTNDTHSAVTLYTLAMDAREREPLDTALVAALLDMASSKIADLERRGYRSTHISALKAAIEAAISKLEGGR